MHNLQVYPVLDINKYIQIGFRNLWTYTNNANYTVPPYALDHCTGSHVNMYLRHRRRQRLQRWRGLYGSGLSCPATKHGQSRVDTVQVSY